MLVKIQFDDDFKLYLPDVPMFHGFSPYNSGENDLNAKTWQKLTQLTLPLRQK